MRNRKRVERGRGSSGQRRFQLHPFLHRYLLWLLFCLPLSPFVLAFVLTFDNCVHEQATLKCFGFFVTALAFLSVLGMELPGSEPTPWWQPWAMFLGVAIVTAAVLTAVNLVMLRVRRSFVRDAEVEV